MFVNPLDATNFNYYLRGMRIRKRAKKLDWRPWYVSQEQAMECIPDRGWLHNAITYANESCDAPTWFHVGTFLTALSAACHAVDIVVLTENGRQMTLGSQFWGVTTGDSGTRKSESANYAVRILTKAQPDLIISHDGSIEAQHDLLAERGGGGLFHKDEMFSLFDSFKRGYSTGLRGWLMETYNGSPLSRITKSGGNVTIVRPRLSIIGNIPPDTLHKKTTREDWRQGFLPRFCFWSSGRERYHRLPTTDNEYEEMLADWLRSFILDNELKVVIPAEVVEPLLDWIEDNVENSPDNIPDELFSTLTRLQQKGIQVAAFLALSELTYRPEKVVTVKPHHIDLALNTMEYLKQSVTELFKRVGSNIDAAEEHEILQYIDNHPGCTSEDISIACDISRRKLKVILLTFLTEGYIISKQARKENQKGAPRKTFFSAEE